MTESYRGWELDFNDAPYGEKYSATSPNYDVDCDIDGFFVCSGCVLTADTIDELKEAIDEYILENEA
jgi:hypothetical protein